MKNPYAIDTNLLVLLTVGTASQQYIESHKRTRIYTKEDYVLLGVLLSEASKIVVTPNVLSETSNLVRQFKQPGVEDVISVFMSIITNSCEIYVESQTATRREEFNRLGLTDAVLIDLGSDDITLLTDDLDLYLAASAKNRKVINFSHERENWSNV